MTILQLRELSAEKAQAARDIMDKADSESRGLTEQEASEFEAALSESKRLETEADRRERLENQEARLDAPQERKSVPEISDGSGSRIEVPGPKMFRYGQLQAFKGPKAQINAYRSGRFLAAVLFNHAASRQYCHEHGIEIRVDNEMQNRAMGEGINTAGGFTVPDEFEQSIIDLREQYGNARKNLRIKVMSSDHSNEPKKNSGLTAYPVGENKLLTESEQSWGNVELTARKWAVLLRISNELSDDTFISLAEDIAMDGALAFATAEDVACIDGDGTSTYNGILGIRTLMIDGNHTGSYYDATSGCDNWSEITEAILLSVMARVPKYARIGAKWHCSPLAKVAVFDRLLRAAGGNTNQNLAEGQPAKYNGYPIEEWPAMPETDAGAALNNKIMLMFGNLSLSSKMGIRKGITIKRLEERYAEYDQIGIRMTERIDINHHSITGATSTAAGPISGLLGGT